MNRDDRSKLEWAYRENKKGLLAWAEGATSSLEDAEDLVQDAFESALSHADSLVDIEDWAAWLFTSLRNKVRDWWRRRKTRRSVGEVSVADEVLVEIVEAAGLGPADLAEEAELYEALFAAIEALPEEQRSVIEAQVLDGLTFRQIADESGAPIDTLAARKRYALRRLADALQGWFEE